MKSFFLLIKCFFLICVVTSLEAVEKICSETECYTVIETLGEGAFGTVYSVEDSQGHKFALKSLKTHPAFPNSILEDIAREYQRGQMLDHKNIIKSLDVFTDSSNEEISHNLLLQLVEGETLYNVEKGVLSSQLVFNAVSEFGDALKHALSIDLLHLDLHDGNIMLTNNREIMLVDLASFFTIDEFMTFIDENLVSQAKSTRLQTEKNDLKVKKMEKFLQRIKAISKNFPQKNGAKTAAVNPIDRDLIHFYYYSAITEVCMHILEKSSLSEDEKLAMKEELRNLVSSMEASYQEGKPVSSEDFFERLLSVFQPISLVN